MTQVDAVERLKADAERRQTRRAKVHPLQTHIIINVRRRFHAYSSTSTTRVNNSLGSSRYFNCTVLHCASSRPRVGGPQTNGMEKSGNDMRAQREALQIARRGGCNALKRIRDATRRLAGSGRRTAGRQMRGGGGELRTASHRIASQRDGMRNSTQSNAQIQMCSSREQGAA